MTSPPVGKFSVKSTSEDITEIYFQIHIYPPTLAFCGCKLAVKQVLAGVRELGLWKFITVTEQKNCL